MANRKEDIVVNWKKKKNTKEQLEIKKENHVLAKKIIEEIEDFGVEGSKLSRTEVRNIIFGELKGAVTEVKSAEYGSIAKGIINAIKKIQDTKSETTFEPRGKKASTEVTRNKELSNKVIDGDDKRVGSNKSTEETRNVDFSNKYSETYEPRGKDKSTKDTREKDLKSKQTDVRDLRRGDDKSNRNTRVKDLENKETLVWQKTAYGRKNFGETTIESSNVEPSLAPPYNLSPKDDPSNKRKNIHTVDTKGTRRTSDDEYKDFDIKKHLDETELKIDEQKTTKGKFSAKVFYQDGNAFALLESYLNATYQKSYTKTSPITKDSPAAKVANAIKSGFKQVGKQYLNNSPIGKVVNSIRKLRGKTGANSANMIKVPSNEAEEKTFIEDYLTNDEAVNYSNLGKKTMATNRGISIKVAGDNVPWQPTSTTASLIGGITQLWGSDSYVKSNMVNKYPEDGIGKLVVYYSGDYGTDKYTKQQIRKGLKTASKADRKDGRTKNRDDYFKSIEKDFKKRRIVRTYDILFEFLPNIDSESIEASYQSREIINRISSIQTWTGTKAPSMSLTTKYFALSPSNDLDIVEPAKEKAKRTAFGRAVQNTLNKTGQLISAADKLINTLDSIDAGTPTLYQYFSQDKINEIEKQYRALAFPLVDNGKASAPPIVQVSLGSMFHYPDGSQTNRFWIVTSVSISKSLEELPAILYKGEFVQPFGFDVTLNLTEVMPKIKWAMPNFYDYIGHPNAQFRGDIIEESYISGMTLEEAKIAAGARYRKLNRDISKERVSKLNAEINEDRKRKKTQESIIDSLNDRLEQATLENDEERIASLKDELRTAQWELDEIELRIDTNKKSKRNIRQERRSENLGLLKKQIGF